MIGNRVCFFQTIPSTNTHMKEHLPEFKHGDIVCAKIQTAGRGRRDRFWISPEGNLHMSVCLSDERVNHPFELVMRASVSIIYVLRNLRISALIKYPNDIIVGHQKIAGMLIEKVEDKYILGVGLNVVLDSQGYDFHPTSIYVETKKHYDYRDILTMFIDAFNDVLQRDSESLYKEYLKYSLVLGRDVMSGDTYKRVENITDAGELVLVDGSTLTANEITLKEFYNDK